MQSAPSNTALATSLPSARVGLGFLIMLSNIWDKVLIQFKKRGNVVILMLQCVTENYVTKNTRVFAEHLLSHLSGTSDGLAGSVAAANHHLLGKKDLFCGDLNAKVTTGNHDAIAGLHDLVKSAPHTACGINKISFNLIV